MSDPNLIVPILLCGGSGTRLWPLSRQSYPKQFATLIGEDSLFQGSALRLSGAGFAPPIVMTAAGFRFIVAEQLSCVGIDPAVVMIEAASRNTGPALLAAAMYQAERDPSTLMLAAPSDHLIPDTAAFHDRVRQGISDARQGQIVTFGIVPDRPETGYGYLEMETGTEADTVRLKGFVEKPDMARATEMIASGRYLWNAGIFLFTAGGLIEAFRAHAPDCLDAVWASVRDAKPDLGFLRLDPAHWAEAPDISIDFAVMEHAKNLVVVPFQGAWSDLGDWAAVWAQSGPDADGVATSGHATALECRDTLLRSEVEGLELVGLGLDNIIAVAMPDAVLVAHKSRVQDVKNVVATLKSTKAPQATEFPKDHRPWGWVEVLVQGDRFQVKRIVVKPGAALSLQSHMHRAEHWVVVHGTAKVTIGETVQLISENQSVYIPLGAVHRLENPGKLPMTLIEIQTGAYLGEDDIHRYEDNYARGDARA